MNSLSWLHGQFVKQPSRHTARHPKVARGTRGEAFEDAVGALDGSHFYAFVNQQNQKPFRNRKGALTQNVLSAVNLDGNFTFVLAGWEGSAHDGRVLNAAIEQHDFMKDLPKGKYYLADAGYTQSLRTFVPFRGVRYHLKEWRQGAEAPQTAKELYNHRHSGLRIVVERVFGIFKRRFQIFSCSTGPQFPLATQIKLIYALTGLHNFINHCCGLGHEFVDSQDVDPSEIQENTQPVPSDQSAGEYGARSTAACNQRLRIAAEMFIEYAPRHGIEVPAEVHVMRYQGISQRS